MADAPDLRAWEAPDGILRDYEDVWLPTSDAPREYQIACALSVVAAVVENRVYLPFGGDRIYVNLWMLLLGPSSFFRKTSTINKAKKTLRRLSTGANETAGILLPDEFSREALLKRLSERGQGLLTYSEFSGALAQFGRDYMSGTKELLTDLYDGPDEYTRLVGEKTWHLKDVCLSILAASQTDWFLEKLKQGDIRGGFLARFCYFPAWHKKMFLAVPPEPDHGRLNRLVSDLNALRSVRGEMTFLPTVRERYSKWLGRHERELHGSSRVGELSAFWSRLSIMALKFAMILQLAHDRRLVLSDESLIKALSLTDFLKAALRELFEEDFAFSKDMQDRQRVLRLVRARPGITFRDLLRASSLLKKQLAPVLDTLQAEGIVELREHGFWPVEASAASGAVSETGTDTIRPMFTRVK